jgi:hypothetical protein
MSDLKNSFGIDQHKEYVSNQDIKTGKIIHGRKNWIYLFANFEYILQIQC